MSPSRLSRAADAPVSGPIPVIPVEFPGVAELARRMGYQPISAGVLPGDVGRRRYLRLRLVDDRTVIGVFYPAEEADSLRRWSAARGLLKDRIAVPTLFADDGAGSQLLEDLGSVDLASRLLSCPSERDLWLDRATEAARSFAELDDPAINAPFDAALFRRELDLAREAVFDLYLGQPLTDEDRRIHDEWAESLADEVAGHPRALCHRDFHGNNLFPRGNAVAAIDFQDLRSGPDSYDLASLLWERTTLEWMDPDRAERSIERFAKSRGIPVSEFRARFDRVLLQRAWKVCGTFARALALGRGEIYRRYLPYEIALVGRLLTDRAEDCRFRQIWESRLAHLSRTA